jgi:hypothetical protein
MSGIFEDEMTYGKQTVFAVVTRVKNQLSGASAQTLTRRESGKLQTNQMSSSAEP